MLPIRRVTLFKHGVAHVERAGLHNGDRLELRWPRSALDDVLKSLVVIDRSGGLVHGVDIEAADDRAVMAAAHRIELGDDDALVSLLRSLRGHEVVVQRASGGSLTGIVLGVDVAVAHVGGPARVTLVVPDDALRPVELGDILAVELVDGAADDLRFVLRAARGDDEHRAGVVRLDPGEHDLHLSYLQPSSAWRVSYRIALDAAGTEALLQAWAVIDNDLGDELEGVELELVAGLPVSFRYRLYEGRTPERPYLEDAVPGLGQPGGGPVARTRPGRSAVMMAAAMPMDADPSAGPTPDARSMSPTMADELEASFGAPAEGEGRGSLFAYRVPTPVSVGRGQSALVPLASVRVAGRRRLLHRAGTVPPHPRAALLLDNATGLALERGPATITDGGRYAGEAVVPFTPVGAELVLTYAIELGVRIDEHLEHDHRVVRVAIDEVGILVEHHQIQRTRYVVASALAGPPGDPTEVIIEQPLAAGTELVATPTPSSQRADVARWTVACPAGGSVELTVSERRIFTVYESAEHLHPTLVEEWRRGGALDPPTDATLSALVTLRLRIDELDGRLAELAMERDRIFDRQQRLGASLQPLGLDGEEGALRRRYVGELGAIEDRLGALVAEEAAMTVARSDLLDQLRAAPRR